MKPIVITGNSIPLTKRLAAHWRGRRIRIEQSFGSLVVKALPPRSLKELLPLTRQVGKQITRQDLNDAIRAVRAKTNQR